ncbi:tol-pal system protein YbgF [Aquicella lusitana]|uniref:Cell division coordinator CpoB n=1 Tax=Aquicella lusitana TaxID=254246 RepID=A0A370GDQ0_9COXI|nr:tol-pal system protein YbgF [Aquicella lusitana]RDI41817.1 tol-pal system protein YbgF [Aquicella lusitana]VVC73725.1 Outer membrane protein assembly factor BamD [Aquicella lusitana]
MQTFSRVIKYVGTAILISIAVPVFAESAPVYDADTMQQQFENIGADQGQDYPPAPEQESAFVPAQQLPAQQAPASVSSPVIVGSSANPEQRIARLEQRLDNLQSNNAGSRVESLQAEVQSLRGQVEQLTHQLQQLQSQQKSMFSDLDKRLAQQNVIASKTIVAPAAPDTKTSNANDEDSAPAPVTVKQSRKSLSVTPSKASAVPPETTAAKSTAGEQPNVAEEQQIYQTAYNLIKAKKYNDAISTLQKMLQKYPSGQFASNAHYWLGELYGLMSKNDQALSEFSLVVKTYPDSPRVSDAQLKVGLIYASQSKWSEAKSAFKKVINRYPGTASSRLASEQLKQIKQAGH